MFNKVSEFYIKRFVEKKLLQYAIENSKKYPQLASYTFDYISMQINIHGVYEKELLEVLGGYLSINSTNKRKIFLDIGANIGNHSLYLSNFFKEVISFEPNKKIFQALSINANKVDNIKPVNLGISDVSSKIYIDYSEWNLGGGKVRKEKFDVKKTGIEAEVKPLDKVINQSDQGNIGLVKIDVEGHEINVLKGMKGILHSSTPLVVIEQLSRDFIINNKGEISSPSIDFLKSQGYRYIYQIGFNDKFFYGGRRIIKLYNLIKFGRHRSYGLVRIKTFKKKFYPMLAASKFVIELD